MSKNVTMKDIAKKLNISLNAVSIASMIKKAYLKN